MCRLQGHCKSLGRVEVTAVVSSDSAVFSLGAPAFCLLTAFLGNQASLSGAGFSEPQRVSPIVAYKPPFSWAPLESPAKAGTTQVFWGP